MDNIQNFLSHGSKYNKFSKPLQAAKVCDTARSLADGRFEVISFKDGLLTLGTSSSSQAANLQAESTQIIAQINQKLEQVLVRKLRFKIV